MLRIAIKPTFRFSPLPLVVISSIRLKLLKWNAVSENYAGKYESKLLKLPKLLGGKDVLKGNELDDLIGSFNLTYYFLKKFFNSIDYNYVKSPFAARERLIDNIKMKIA